jgi:DEAD/DEAH box helicase domain-containing protein
MLLVHDCACARGCPACIGPVLEHDEHRGRDAKRAALRVLALLADGTGPDVATATAGR